MKTMVPSKTVSSNLIILISIFVLPGSALLKTKVMNGRWSALLLNVIKTHEHMNN